MTTAILASVERKPTTKHLSAWSEQEQLTAAEQVKSLLEHPGWEYVTEAARLRIELVQHQLLNVRSDSAADYADLAGQMKGLQELPALAQGIIEQGERTERARAAREHEGVLNG